jgi:DNA-binding transcriptional ArsR family regulator
VEVAEKFDLAQMTEAADKASGLMKTLGHKGRLMILCQLAGGEKSVGELSRTLGMPQSPLSQHLSRMRREGLVKTRRNAQTIYYSLHADEAGKLIKCLYEIYCANDQDPAR